MHKSATCQRKCTQRWHGALAWLLKAAPVPCRSMHADMAKLSIRTRGSCHTCKCLQAGAFLGGQGLGPERIRPPLAQAVHPGAVP